MENINNNREILLNEINKCHQNSNFKNLDTPRLIAVSKKQEDYKIDLAIKSGQKIFGENRVQEAQARWEERLKIHNDLELRLIGPLQTNKIKQALKLFNKIETIDREKLAKGISVHFEKNVTTSSFYIQVNTGSEAQKNGLLPLEADAFITYCIYDLKLPIIGLMCIPPENEEPAMHFNLLKKIAIRNNLKELSMGMSNDYQEAIKFGATSVRIGSLFFGKREY
ncbi:YggS family pyridoxal phosphate-dependent enzyme [Alphaproteobacteria bacterium]|nr:YggS family pyridoxal phosphate-dependent enzyme [Alphaproteobacteria bacterium]